MVRKVVLKQMPAGRHKKYVVSAEKGNYYQLCLSLDNNPPSHEHCQHCIWHKLKEKSIKVIIFHKYQIDLRMGALKTKKFQRILLD